MRVITQIVKDVISGIEAEMNVEKKHAIKTDTIKSRCERRFPMEGDDDFSYLARTGLAQLIQSQLYEKGYRSVRTGVFVNFEVCVDPYYIAAMLDNAEELKDEKLWKRNDLINEFKKKKDPQISFYFDDEGMPHLKIPMTEEEFLEKLEADAV